MFFDKSIINKDYPHNYIFDLQITGYKNDIIGIDEAGRGALAGPVVIAGVVPDYNKPIKGITDSKKLSAKQRDELYEQIINSGSYKYHISVIAVDIIDSINILNATKKGMMECLEKLYIHYSFAIIDAVKLKIKDKTVFSIIKADLKSAAVGAASILAKVTRDRILIKLSEKYKGYGLEQNKGYATALHREALKKYGVTKIHRKSYAPVRHILEEGLQSELF